MTAVDDGASTGRGPSSSSLLALVLLLAPLGLPQRPEPPPHCFQRGDHEEALGRFAATTWIRPDGSSFRVDLIAGRVQTDAASAPLDTDALQLGHLTWTEGGARQQLKLVCLRHHGPTVTATSAWVEAPAGRRWWRARGR